MKAMEKTTAGPVTKFLQLLRSERIGIVRTRQNQSQRDNFERESYEF
jgi:hypothetical protein